MQLFDAHTHIDMKHYQNDRERVIQRAKDAGLVGMVTSSIGPGSFRRTLGIIEKHKDFIYHTAGCQVSRLTNDETNKILALIQRYAKDLVAIGEVGLDYHWVTDASARKAQEPLFRSFIHKAEELNLPIVIHSRKAEAEATAILEKEFTGPVLMHCYDGLKDTTERISSNGWYITLPANFDRYRNRVAAAKALPLEQILLETDGPYLSPIDGRNEPANIRYGCQSLAKHLDLPVEYIAEATTRNARKFYGL